MTAVQTFMADQAEAAHLDAVRSLVAAAGRLNFTHSYRRPTPWVQRLIDGTINIPAKHRRTCQHLRKATPCVTFLDACDRMIRCARCEVAALERIRGTPENFTCDRCRRVSAPSQFFSAAFVVGTTLVNVGVCRDCRPDVIGIDT